jgi:imidazolonepropionase-like amidohydrolase
VNRFICAIMAAALAWSIGPPAHAQSEAESGAIVVYRDITLIDGTGAAPRPHVSIVTEGPVIRAILAPGEAAPAGAREVDAGGLYVVPGLIDAHVHVATPPNAAVARGWLRRQLYAGVTAVRDMADDLRSVAELSRQARVGEIPAPDIYFAALMAGESFFDDPRTHAAAEGETAGGVPWMQAITDRTDLRLAVAMARGTGASGVKIYANLPARLVRNITREAHRQGIPVWAHAAVYPASPADVASAGVDVMSHACSLAHQAQPTMPQTYASRTPMEDGDLIDGANPAIARVVDEMARRGIILDATVRVYAIQDQARADDPTRRRGLCSAALSYAMARQAFRAGVRIAAGTDGETPAQDAYPALLEELQLLQDEIGMSPLDVIRAATQTNAAALGHSEDMGVVAPGRLANLVFTRDDPSANVANLRSVQFVVRRGLAFQRSDYTPISAEEAEH